MENGNFIPRVNGSSLLDFDKSHVNRIYTAAPNRVVGSFSVVGYLIITIADILWLIWYIPTLILILFLFRFGLPIVVKNVWNKFDARWLKGRFQVAVPRPLSPRYTPASRPASLDSPVDWSMISNSATHDPPPCTPTSPSSANTVEGSKTMSVSSGPTPEEIFPASKKPWPGKYTPPSTRSTVRTHSSPATTPSSMTSRTEQASKRSSISPSQTFRYDMGKETVVRILGLCNKAFIALWNNIGTISLILFGAVSIYVYLDANPASTRSSSAASFFRALQESSDSVASFSESLKPSNAMSVVREYISSICEYLRGVVDSITSFFGSLFTATNALFLISLPVAFALGVSWTVAVPSFLAFAIIHFFYQALWTGFSGSLLVFVALVIIRGFQKVWFLLPLLLVGPARTRWIDSGCVNSLSITALSLLIIAFASWAAQTVFDSTKAICPHFVGLPIALFCWQPVFWTVLILAGRKLDILDLSHFQQIHLWDANFWLYTFTFLAVFKGLKIFIHTISYYLWTDPVQPPSNPTITPADVTVVVPATCFEQEFIDTLLSILANEPARVIISVVGYEKRMQAIEACARIDPRIEVISVLKADAHTQLIRAIEHIETPIAVFADDHVYWPRAFLRSALAPFEDPIVGLAGTTKRVIRNHDLPFCDNVFNYIACIYLERQNFECTATYNIDGGVSVISSHTALFRTSVLHSLSYRSEFQAEHYLDAGPITIDDDNFNTRFMTRHGYRTVFHADSKAIIETTLVNDVSQLTKFRDQLLRSARTAPRSNLKSLITDRACYQRTPWTTYAIFISSFFNYAIFYDAALFYSLKWSGSGHLCALILCLLVSKLIKSLPHLLRHPSDLNFVLLGILFGYLHGFVKLYAFFTMGRTGWNGRPGIVAIG